MKSKGAFYTCSRNILYSLIIVYPATIILELETMDVIRFLIRKNEAELMDILLTSISIVPTAISIYSSVLLYKAMCMKNRKRLQKYIKLSYVMYITTALVYLAKEYRFETGYPLRFKQDGILPRSLWYILTWVYFPGTPIAISFLFQLERIRRNSAPDVVAVRKSRLAVPWIDMNKLLNLQLIVTPMYGPMGLLRLYGKLKSGAVAAEIFRNDIPYLIIHSVMITCFFCLWFGIPFFYHGMKQRNPQKIKIYLATKCFVHVLSGSLYFTLNELEENVSGEYESITLRIFTTFYTMWCTTEICQVVIIMNRYRMEKTSQINNGVFGDPIDNSTIRNSVSSEICYDLETLSSGFSQIPKSFRISTSRLKVDMINSNCIGEGQFGRVWKGCLATGSYPKKKIVPVAMKVINDGLSDDEFQTSVLSEVKTLIKAETHLNLVRFYGSCLDKEKFQLGIILEFCELGSLKSWFKQEREFAKENKIDFSVSDELLSKWSNEIAIGMEHLSSKKIIHGDLALRNVLLGENQVAKISDFGMSIRLYNYQRYAVSSMQVFPWKWMAPESLSDLKFSVESDAWSFAVLLWEIYSLGRTPWPGLLWSSDFVNKLKSGSSLEKPDLAPEKMYEEIMLKCWTVEPSERLKFKEIVHRLQELQKEEIQQMNESLS